MNYCYTHHKQCFDGATSTSCRRESLSNTIIVDFYIPKHIIEHRIVRGGGSAPQLQFKVEWKKGWTENKKLGKVIRAHPIQQGLYLVQYTPSWEPYNNFSITTLINPYKIKKSIAEFGQPFDKNIEQIKPKNYSEDLVPTYNFEYKPSVSNATIEPTLKKKRGRPSNQIEPKSKREVKERTPDCGCMLRCMTTFDQFQRKKIKSEYQSLTDFSAKSSWISKLVELNQIPFQTPALQIRTSGKRRKKYRASYHLYKNSKRTRVCQYFFMNTIGIGNTLLNNLNDHNHNHGTGNNQISFRQDNRGKHKPSHAASQDTISVLKNHIFSFPREKSHYTIGNKMSLSPDLTIKKMWELYKEQHEQALGYSRYLKEFNKYNLQFGSYKTDTCSRCDELSALIGTNPENIEELKQERNQHLREADIGYKMQKNDRETAGKRHESIWGDMMSVIQIPKVSTSVSFYKRKYRVYNEGFYLASSKKHSMLLWGELNAKKKPLSALHEFLETVPETKHLICWFDGTSSQLKNVNTLLYFLHISDPTSPMYKFERISVKYNIVGHTYMSPGPDQAFAQVSKAIKKKTVIADPKELLNIIDDDCKNCSAQWLQRQKHIDWGDYLRQYYVADKSFLRVNGIPLLRKARTFEFGFSQVFDPDTNQSIILQNNTNEIKVKLSFEQDAKLYSFSVEQNDDPEKQTYSNFPAHRRRLKLEKKRIKDLIFQKKYLPARYNTDDIEIYNLDPTADAIEDEMTSSESD